MPALKVARRVFNNRARITVVQEFSSDSIRARATAIHFVSALLATV
jgi:hypothetical protein